MISSGDMSRPQAKSDQNTVIVAKAGRIPVIACGSRWLVVDKPCGMSIHNDPGRDLCSLALAAVRAGRLPAMSLAIFPPFIPSIASTETPAAL